MKLNFGKFSRSALLAVAIAALPALSVADPIVPTNTSISSGNFISATFSGTPTIGDTFTVSVNGSLGTFVLDTGTLADTGISGLFSFTGGTVSVTNAQGTFTNSLTNGIVRGDGLGSFTATAFLAPTSTLTDGTATFGFTVANGVIVAATGGVTFRGELTPPSEVPEPSSIMLLGSGLLGLAGFARGRFLKT